MHNSSYTFLCCQFFFFFVFFISVSLSLLRIYNVYKLSICCGHIRRLHFICFLSVCNALLWSESNWLYAMQLQHRNRTFDTFSVFFHSLFPFIRFSFYHVSTCFVHVFALHMHTPVEKYWAQRKRCSRGKTKNERKHFVYLSHRFHWKHCRMFSSEIEIIFFI